MRQTLVTLGLVAVLLMTAANDAFAQRGGARGWGRGGWGNNGYYYGRNNGYWGRGGVYIGIGGWGSGYYGGGYYPYYSDGYYYSSPDYVTSDYYPAPVVQVPAPDSQTSYYSDPNAATITVVVPNPNAEVWFDDVATAQRGNERSFTTPSLQKAGTYTIKARWTDRGRTINQERHIRVQPGQAVMVDFRAENLAPPPAPKP
jgi:uncharacterized protein (TIGR03000 family)